MSGKIRVFISSTMKDLANERDLIVQKLNIFNVFEPVNAESWLPGGGKTWERIAKEVESSHLFVLVLGESYGWIPTDGAGAKEGLSVTHMEFRKAKKSRIPILAFLKRLDYGTSKDTEDAQKRDAFRQEVSDWSKGQLISKYELARDLAEKVSDSVIMVLKESYLQERVQERIRIAAPPPPVLEPPPTPELTSFNRAIIKSLARDKAILFAGAGMSLAAGYPSQQALTKMLIAEGGLEDVLSGVPNEFTFSGVTQLIQFMYSRDMLIKLVTNAMDVVAVSVPEEAKLAVQLFDKIITTNYDCLFERAYAEHRLDFSNIKTDWLPLVDMEKKALLKLNGSIDDPKGLILTDNDLRRFWKKPPRGWPLLNELIGRNPVVIIGSSLSDPRLQELFRNRRLDTFQAFIVSPMETAFNRLMNGALGLKWIQASADAFLRELQMAVTDDQIKSR